MADTPAATSGGELGERRGDLDAIAALTREPEQPGDLEVEADDGAAVGGERSESGPRAPHRSQGKTRGVTHALERERHVELIGLRVARREWCLVGRRDQQTAGLGLAVVTAGDVHHKWPFPDVVSEWHEAAYEPLWDAEPWRE